MIDTHESDEAPAIIAGASCKFTIYCIVHVATGRRYIGVTSQSLDIRWRQHVHRAFAKPNPRYAKSHWHAAIRKYGRDAFVVTVLDVCSTLISANAAELRWIKLHDSTNPKRGFNRSPGGSYIPVKPRERTHCPHGHEYTPENISIQAGNRICRECHRLRGRVKPEDRKNRHKTHCLRGHLMDGDNLVINSRGNHVCRECFNATARKTQSRIRAKAAAERGPKLPKTHCKHGHEYTLENTRLRKSNGARECRDCERAKYALRVAEKLQDSLQSNQQPTAE